MAVIVLAAVLLTAVAWTARRRYVVRLSASKSRSANPVNQLDFIIVPRSSESRAWRVYSTIVLMRGADQA